MTKARMWWSYRDEMADKKIKYLVNIQAACVFSVIKVDLKMRYNFEVNYTIPTDLENHDCSRNDLCWREFDIYIYIFQIAVEGKNKDKSI